MTGTWFAEGSQCNAWRGDPGSFIWLHGIRKFVWPPNLDRIVNSCRSTVGLGYTYFYFTFNEPESKGGYHVTVLHAASLESQEAVVKLLLDAGADVNASSAYYGAPLATASARGHDSVVKLLAASNAFLYAFGVRYGIT